MHVLHHRLLEERVMIAVAGCGGNGAQMVGCLARLDTAMRALGHPFGLHVTAYEPKVVTAANIGRQVFYPADVGVNKAVAMIHRINMAYGLDWDAWPTQYRDDGAETRGRHHDCHILISCVDTARSRREMRAMIERGEGPTDYWLDLGNTESSGQAVLGEVNWAGRKSETPALPFITDLFPEFMDAARPEDDTPSCSARVSLLSQGLFLNDVVVRFAAQLLFALFSEGKVSHHGVHVNLETGRVAPILATRETWARYGHAVDGPADTRESATASSLEAA